MSDKLDKYRRFYGYENTKVVDFLESLNPAKGAGYYIGDYTGNHIVILNKKNEILYTIKKGRCYRDGFKPAPRKIKYYSVPMDILDCDYRQSDTVFYRIQRHSEVYDSKEQKKTREHRDPMSWLIRFLRSLRGEELEDSENYWWTYEEVSLEEKHQLLDSWKNKDIKVDVVA